MIQSSQELKDLDQKLNLSTEWQGISADVRTKIYKEYEEEYAHKVIEKTIKELRADKKKSSRSRSRKNADNEEQS